MILHLKKNELVVVDTATEHIEVLAPKAAKIWDDVTTQTVHPSEERGGLLVWHLDPDKHYAIKATSSHYRRIFRVRNGVAEVMRAKSRFEPIPKSG